MATRVTIRINQAAVRSLSAPGGDIDNAVRRAAARTRERARRNVDRVDTGRLRQSIASERVGPGHYRVGSNLDYAIYQEQGTRAHGPRTARVLRFKPKGSAVFVFARRVRGVRPSRFLRRALDALRPNDFA